MKKTAPAAALAGAVALALAACGSAPADTATDATTPADDGGTGFRACMVSNQGGWDDRSFNQSSAEGLARAQDALGVETVLVESTAPTDFAPNIDSLVQQDCDLVIGVGFNLADALTSAAEANPDVDFALIDSAFGSGLDNAKPLLFDTQEAAFLAGYLAAGTSTTGTVATFGGMPLPSVTIFMDGFADGVAHFNAEHDADVRLLGWDKDTQTGSFSGDFESQADGQNLARGFIDQGADVIMPVAGPVGLGVAAAAQESGDVLLIGVDADWVETSPDLAPIILTSVLKQVGQAVLDTVADAVGGTFSAEPYVGTLGNAGLGLAPFHDLDDRVPDAVRAAIEDLTARIVAGELVVESPAQN